MFYIEKKADQTDPFRVPFHLFIKTMQLIYFKFNGVSIFYIEYTYIIEF